MISTMALSNQGHFPRFFSPRKMTYRNLAGAKNKLVRLNDFYDGFVQPKSLSAIFQSPEYGFRLTTSRNRPAPVSHLPPFADSVI